MASDLNPGIFKKKNGKNYEAMVLVASADAGLSQKWALALRDAFAIQVTFERAGLERVMSNIKPAVLLLDSNLPQLDKAEDGSAIQQLSPSRQPR